MGGVDITNGAGRRTVGEVSQRMVDALKNGSFREQRSASIEASVAGRWRFVGSLACATGKGAAITTLALVPRKGI